VPAGTANISGKETSIPTAPMAMKRDRDPLRAADLSLQLPTMGRNSMSQTFGRSTTIDARPAATPSVSVR